VINSVDISDTPVVILCGGKGSRMGNITTMVPKSLALIQGNPILWYIILSLYMDGFRRFILPLGYKGEMIRDYVDANLSDLEGIKINCIDTGENTNIAKRISIVLQHVKIDQEILLLNGDAVFDFSFSQIYRDHLKSSSLITLVSIEVQSQWGLILEHEGQVEGFVREHRVKYFCSSSDEGYRGYVYSGMAFININALDQIDLVNSDNFENDLYPRLIKSNRISNIKMDGFWYSMDTPKDVALINDRDSANGKKLHLMYKNIVDYLEM